MVPEALETAFVALVAIMLAVLIGIVFSGVKRMGGKPARAALIVSVGMLAWLAFIGLMAHLHSFDDFTAMPPRLLVVLLPAIAALVWFARSKRITPWLDAVPGHYFAYAQVFRLPLELILWQLFVAGIIPEQMTFEGYNFDVLTALLAPVIAYGYFQRKKLSLHWAIRWNIAGILLVLTIVTISITSTPSPLRLWDNEPANTIIAAVPFVWLPGFLVPLALLFHIASLRQLIRGPVDSYDLPADAYKVPG